MSAALTVGMWVIVGGSIVAIGIAMLQGIAAGALIEAGALLENGPQVEIQLARTIDLAVRAREIAAVEIELEVEMSARGIAVASETVVDSVAATHVQAAAEVLPAWAVRAVAVAALVVEVAAVVVAAAVEVVGGRGFVLAVGPTIGHRRS